MVPPTRPGPGGIVADASGISTQLLPGTALLPMHPFHSTAKTCAQSTRAGAEAATKWPPESPGGTDTWEGPHVTETIEPTATPKKKSGGLNTMLLADLKSMAGGLGIRGAGSMKKAQLVDAIKAAQSGGQAKTEPKSQQKAEPKAEHRAESKSEQKVEPKVEDQVQTGQDTPARDDQDQGAQRQGRQDRTQNAGRQDRGQGATQDQNRDRNQDRNQRPEQRPEPGPGPQPGPPGPQPGPEPEPGLEPGPGQRPGRPGCVRRRRQPSQPSPPWP